MDYPAAKAFILSNLEQRLSEKLYYHGIHHTLDVLRVTVTLCAAEKIPAYETTLLKTAALYHDCGFITNNINHEQHGCDIVKSNLGQFHYTDFEIEQICGMIMATKVPQSPSGLLEEIICDADLDYLGRHDFNKIGNTLFEELKAYKVLTSEEEWNQMQIRFLESHTFFTKTNKQTRAPQKAKHLENLKEIVNGYKKNL